jgi:hypothetical protein
MANKLPLHYWQLHRHECLKAWNKLSQRQADIVAADVEGKSNTFIEFAGNVETTALDKFMDAEHPVNQPYRFKTSRNEFNLGLLDDLIK